MTMKYELKKCIDSVATISNGVLSRIDNINSLSNMIDIIVNYMPLKKERICEYANELGLIKRSEMIIYDIYKEYNDPFSSNSPEATLISVSIL